MMKIQTTVLAVIAATVGVASAATISVNFTEGNDYEQIDAATGAGIGGLTHWNNVSGNSGTQGSLMDSTGAATEISITWDSRNTYRDDEATADAKNDIGNAQLVRGYLDDGGDHVSISVTGMTTPYDVTLYLSTDNDTGQQFRPFTINGVLYQAQGSYAGYGSGFTWGPNNSMTIKGETGNLLITGLGRDGASRGSVAGIQITTAVPEPSSVALLGLGGLALILRRRK